MTLITVPKNKNEVGLKLLENVVEIDYQNFNDQNFSLSTLFLNL